MEKWLIMVYMTTCVIHIRHIVSLRGLAPVVVDNAKQSEFSHD